MIRDTNIQIISKEIKSLPDINITNIYDKMWELCEEEGEKTKSRVQKIKFIIGGLELIQDDEVLKIKDTIDGINKYKKMYKALLKLLNLILEHNDMDIITDITEFKNIDRTCLATEECNQLVVDNMDDLINADFKKNTNGFNSSKNLMHANLKIIKGCCVQIDHEFISIKKSTMKNKVRSFTTYYSIKKTNEV